MLLKNVISTNEIIKSDNSMWGKTEINSGAFVVNSIKSLVIVKITQNVFFFHCFAIVSCFSTSEAFWTPLSNFSKPLPYLTALSSYLFFCSSSVRRLLQFCLKCQSLPELKHFGCSSFDDFPSKYHSTVLFKHCHCHHMFCICKESFFAASNSDLWIIASDWNLGNNFFGCLRVGKSY